MAVDGEVSGEAGDRLTRAAEASEGVAGLDAMDAGEVASTVSEWLRSAYEMFPICRERDCHGLAFVVLGHGSDRLLLSCVRAGFEATPEDAEHVAAMGWRTRATSALLVQTPVLDAAMHEEGLEAGVRVWGRQELEILYREIEHEVGGLAIW